MRISLALFTLLVAAPVHAQSIQLSEESLDGRLDLSAVEWRYHPGDSLEWADPAFDDSAWDLRPLATNPDSLRGWTGIGWFRLRLHVDSSLRGAAVAYAVYQAGASEIYLNGELIQSYGHIGMDATTDSVTAPKGLPGIMTLGDDSTAVLVVRFAGRSAAHWFGRWYSPPEELFSREYRLLLAPANERIEQYAYTSLSIWSRGLVSGVLLLMVVLHLSIFLLDRKEYANLSLALFASLWGITIFTNSIIMAPFFVSQIAVWQMMVTANGLALGMLALAASIHLIFRNRISRPVLILMGTFCVLWVLTIFGYGPSIFPVVLVFLVLLILEAVRLPIVAAWRRVPGAWMFLVGGSIMVGQMLYNVFGPENQLLPGELYASPGLMQDEGAVLATMLLPIPICASLFLSMRFVRNLRELKSHVAEVERLSAETLAQEKEKQALIERQKVELEVTVDERTSDLRSALSHLQSTQARLIEQEKLASLGSLTAGIAHEIKNPLNFVNNFAEVSRELADELAEAVAAGRAEEARAIIADIKQNAEQIAKHGGRADSIVRSMMQHARGGASERETIDVNAFMEEYVDLAWHGMRARDHTFQCDVERSFDPGAGTIEGQPQELGRVLLNLLNNAFYAVSMEGATSEPRVQVTTTRTDGRVTIQVSDSGPGIPDDIREKIFEPFFTTKPTGEGTGLGLSLSYDIVTKGHGGEMIVDDAPDGGARFTVRLRAE